MQPGKNHGGGTGNNRTINDSHFVDELRNNSNRAWSKLLAEFWEPMRLMALRICGPHTPEADIEDILQETLLGAFQNIDRFRGDSAFSTFLLGILRHKASDYIAAKRCLNKLAFRAMPRQVFRQNARFEHPDPRLGLADCLRELIAAERPRSPRRQALQLIKNILADSENIPSLKEMARLWGCSPKHAKWLWHDAKRGLKQRYRESTVDANYPRKHSEMQPKTPLMPLTHPTHAAPMQRPCSTRAARMQHSCSARAAPVQHKGGHSTTHAQPQITQKPQKCARDVTRKSHATRPMPLSGGNRTPPRRAHNRPPPNDRY